MAGCLTRAASHRVARSEPPVVYPPSAREADEVPSGALKITQRAMVKRNRSYGSVCLSDTKEALTPSKITKCCGSSFIKSIQLKNGLQRPGCLVGWGCRIHWLHLCRGVRPPMSVHKTQPTNQRPGKRLGLYLSLPSTRQGLTQGQWPEGPFKEGIRGGRARADARTLQDYVGIDPLSAMWAWWT